MNKEKRKPSEYKLTLIDASSFEEVWRIRCSRQSVVLWSTLCIIFLFVFSFCLIYFTPIRDLMPSSNEVRYSKELNENFEIIDNLRDSVSIYGNYINSIQTILTGDSSGVVERDTNYVAPQYNINNMTFGYDNETEKFMSKMEREEMFGLLHNEDEKGSNSIFSFFVPVKGYVSSTFDPSRKHFGIDIVTNPNEMIHATLEGTVLLAGFTLDTGNTIAIQHKDGFISFYKHNSKLLKNEGDKVMAGDAVAIVGNTGEETSGPHLHFELWKHGEPLDPLEYINIEKK